MKRVRLRTGSVQDIMTAIHRQQAEIQETWDAGTALKKRVEELEKRPREIDQLLDRHFQAAMDPGSGNSNWTTVLSFAAIVISVLSLLLR